MYFCYIDESGDHGVYDSAAPENTGTPYFILAGVIIHSAQWKVSLGTLKTFRKKLAAEAFLPYDVEFHCSDMISPHAAKAFISISIENRWKLIEQYAELIGLNQAFSLITVVINKATSTIPPGDYLKTAITKFYLAFDEFLKAKESNGIVFFDGLLSKHAQTHIRTLLGTGVSGATIPGIRIGWVLEDPIFKVSHESMFIQSADVVAYTLKEKEFPQSSRRKHQAHKIFTRKILRICYKSAIADEDGIIRIKKPRFETEDLFQASRSRTTSWVQMMQIYEI